MSYVKLAVSLFSAGSALEARQLVLELLMAGLPADHYQPSSGDLEVEIEEHSGHCSVEVCGEADRCHEAETRQRRRDHYSDTVKLP